MKNAIIYCISFLLLLKLSPLHAQQSMMHSSNYYNYVLYEENHKIDENKKNRLKNKKTIIGNKSSKAKLLKYDPEGRIIEYAPNKKKGVKLNYSIGDQEKSLTSYKKGKIVELDSFLWQGKSLKQANVFNGKNKIVKRESYKYDSTFVTEYLYERLKRGKLSEHIKRIYEYYPDYRHKKISYYKNGKPDYFSVFDCNPIGEDHKISKDSAYHCVKYDADSLGNKIIVTITNQRGFSSKIIEYFNSKDERIASKTFDLKNKGKLLWEYHFKPGTMMFTKFVSYKRNKEYYKIENV